MLFITDVQADQMESLRDSADRAQLMADAQRVYSYIRRNEWIAEADLRAYGERNDLKADRLNAALAFLTQAGRLVPVPIDEAPAVVGKAS